ncbi:MAG: hypothetical protein ABR898_17750 [Terracidiphilus sp.]|jgi:hypothetical protein
MAMKSVFLALAILTANPVLFAQAGKPVTSHHGACQVTVPTSWSVSGMFGIANSPDNKVSVAVTSPIRTTSLDETKQMAPMVYPNDKVTKSTAAEFQMEGLSMNNKPNVYRGIQLTGKVCLVEVIYESGTVDDARTIAATLKSAK